MKTGVFSIVLGWSLALLVLAGNAAAATPEDGVWWNPNQSGRGWFIVSQNNIMVVTSYTFSDAGASQWYLSSGQYNPATSTFSAPLLGFRDGQCLGCPYRAPTQGASPGTLRIVFQGDDRATLTQPGETVQLQKFMFGYPQINDRLWGEWAYAGNVALGTGDAEFLVFDRAFTASNGGQFVQGRRRFSSVGLALAAYNETLNEYAVLLDSSSSFYKLYVYEVGANRTLEGRWWLYRKTEQATGNGSFMSAMRVRERSDVASAQSAPAAFEKDGVDEGRDLSLEKSMRTDAEAPAHIRAWAAELAAELESAKRAQSN